MMQAWWWHLRSSHGFPEVISSPISPLLSCASGTDQTEWVLAISVNQVEVSSCSQVEGRNLQDPALGSLGP